jgi:putative endonuclease
MIDRIAIGRAAEAAAESFLRQRGLRTLQRNFHCRMGEIDLIMRDADCLVFTEVRFRRPGQHGNGAESITHAKRRKLITCAAWYLRSKKISSHQVCRFDVVSVGQVSGVAGSPFEFDWIRNAFDADN